MNTWVSRAALTVLFMSATASWAQASDPEGVWEADNRESRYEISYCGPDNARLCARLIWIQEDKKDARNTKYLDQYMFREAREVRPGRWQGTTVLEGLNVRGTLSQRSADRIELSACALLVFCEHIGLNRVTP